MNVETHATDRLVIDGKPYILRMSIDSHRFFINEGSVLIRLADNVVLILSHSTGQKLLDSLQTILPKRIEDNGQKGDSDQS